MKSKYKKGDLSEGTQRLVDLSDATTGVVVGFIKLALVLFILFIVVVIIVNIGLEATAAFVIAAFILWGGIILQKKQDIEAAKKAEEENGKE